MKQGPLAVIDIGSNTIRSLIVQPLPDRTWRVLDDEREVARLASGLDQRGRLSATAMQRAIKALSRMAEIARARGARRVAVVATSAIRNARNRDVFISRVRAETGLRVRVISGQEEAQLAFESAAESFDLADQPCVVVDVGGGSTEVILALGTHIQGLYSLHLGTVALTEQFLQSDPVKGKEFRALRQEIRQQLESARVAADPPPQFLIASGGTASSLAQVAMALQGLQGRSAQGYAMTQAQLLHLREELTGRTLTQRRELPGLAPDRADIIIAGAAILSEIMLRLRVNRLRVSTRGIRHALLYRLIAGRPRRAASSTSRHHRLDAAARLARSLRCEQRHGEQVQRLALSLFDQLGPRLKLDAGVRDLLAAAALLHDAGYVVSYQQHHKHSYHLISHAAMDGFTPREREIIAQVARFHRGSMPRKKHTFWRELARGDRTLVLQLSALLRIADALDRRHSQGVDQIVCGIARRRARIALSSPHPLPVEIHAAEEKAGLFTEVFGLDVTFTQSLSRPGPRAAPAHQNGAEPSSRRASA